MFGFSKRVFYVKRGKISAAKVCLWGKNKVRKQVESTWGLNDLLKVILKLKKEVRARKIRVLLSEDISYILKMKIPTNLSSDDERKHIASKIREKIPEQLSNSEWDFKEVRVVRSIRKGSDIDEKEVLIFAPVKKISDVVIGAMEKAGLIIEAIEPEQIAKKRDENPIVGLAKKKDIRGKDEKVLNLLPVSKSKAPESDQKGGRGKSIFLAIFILVIFGLMGLGGYIYLNNQSTNEVIEATPTSTQTPTPTEKISKDEIYDYSIYVLNGSGIPGKASEIADALTERGFNNISIGNADGYVYENIIITIENDLLEEVFNEIEGILDSEHEVNLNQEHLGDESEYDVEIIVGKSLE